MLGTQRSRTPGVSVCCLFWRGPNESNPATLSLARSPQVGRPLPHCHGIRVVALLAAVAPAQAQSSAPLDKHSRRIEKRLAKFRQGTFLDFEFRDSSQTFGSLGPLSAASFQFTDSDSNKTQTHSYSDLVRSEKGEGVHRRRLGAVTMCAFSCPSSLALASRPEALRPTKSCTDRPARHAL